MKTTNKLFPFLLLPLLAFAEYEPPPQQVARTITPEQARMAIAAAPANATVSAPAWLLRASGSASGNTNNTEQLEMLQVIARFLAEARASIPESSGLSDLEIASLYIAQTKKDAAILAQAAPSNTVEYLIGAGMRQDIALMSGQNQPNGENTETGNE